MEAEQGRPREPHDRPGEPPPGEPPPGEPPPPPRGHTQPPDPAALFAMLDGMRRMAPRELEDQITNLIREFLLTLRSLIDWYLERLDRKPPEPRVEDIPIDYDPR
jgi:hypothetical protein